jgi:hypothetical protein
VNAPAPEKDREEDEDLGVFVADEEEASDHAGESVLSLTVPMLSALVAADRGEGRAGGLIKPAALVRGLAALATVAGVAAHIEEKFSGGGPVKCAQKRILNDVP